MAGSVLLTREQVEEWRRERDELVRKISGLNEQRQLLDKRLDAASLFINLPNSAAPARTDLLSDAGNSHDDSGVTLVDAVIDVLKRTGKAMTNAQIKRGLSTTGFDVSRLSDSPNYFYTVTKRLKDRGIIVRRSNGRYVLKNIEAPEVKPNGTGTSEASQERRVDRPAEPNPSGPESPLAGGGT